MLHGYGHGSAFTCRAHKKYTVDTSVDKMVDKALKSLTVNGTVSSKGCYHWCYYTFKSFFIN